MNEKPLGFFPFQSQATPSVTPRHLICQTHLTGSAVNAQVQGVYGSIQTVSGEHSCYLEMETIKCPVNWGNDTV